LTSERFLVAVHVENEGPQFHLGNLQFVDGTVIPDAELRQVFPLREGEIFSVKKVRAGIEALTKLYNSHGYIDFTVIPDVWADSKLQRISLVMKLDEKKQYHVGTVDIRGLNPDLEARLRSILVPGETFNGIALDAFLKENRAVLPPRGMDNFEFHRDPKTGIVDLTFYPHSCP
jgi:outer membrane protein assembly factor BamA